MRSLYTKTGDSGTTGLIGGVRVSKDDLRIEANGTLDELNSLLGVVRSLLGEADGGWQTLLTRVQVGLMGVMSHVATPPGRVNPNVLEADALTRAVEEEIDRLTALMPDEHSFILPGGTPLSAQMHLARTVCRRAERRLCTLHRQVPLDESILRFVNRLSDLLYAMARAEMFRQGWTEEKWNDFAYKTKRSRP